MYQMPNEMRESKIKQKYSNIYTMGVLSNYQFDDEIFSP